MGFLKQARLDKMPVRVLLILYRKYLLSHPLNHCFFLLKYRNHNKLNHQRFRRSSTQSSLATGKWGKKMMVNSAGE